ncbi:hypothetical protein D3C86_1783350 [compost metagenome]
MVNRHTTKSSLDGRGPEVGIRGVHLFDFNLLAIQRQVTGSHHLRHGQTLRRALAKDRAPVAQLGILGLVDMVNHMLVGQHFDIRERRHDGLQTEVEVGVTGTDIHSGQLLAALLDHLDQRLAILHVELGIDQDRLLVTGHQ